MQVFISRITLSFLFFSINFLAYSQLFDIQPPLDIPLFLSGNFGELRSTHFHAGIDIKTQGEIGKKVYSVADGYVSRIKIQTGGYGHSVYIKHPNGYTSVYAHLDKFYPELEAFVKNQQYAKKKYEIDIYPEKAKFPIWAGQQIGISGNTGSSGGPHLHLEIRDKSEAPVNVLNFFLPIKDTIPPVFKNLVVYQSIDAKTFQFSSKEFISVNGKQSEYRIEKPVKVSDISAFGIEIYDYLNGAQNKCGIYTLDFSIDDQLYFSMHMDEISFDEASYIKTYTDYAEKILNGTGIHRMFIETNNKLTIYNPSFNNGLYYLDDTLEHNAKIVATDVYGNKSKLEFKLVHNSGSSSILDKTSGLTYLYCDRDNEISDSSIIFKIPFGALYSDKTISFSKIPQASSFYSNTYCLGNELIPMNRYPSLSIKLKNQFLKNADKLVVVRIDTTGKISSEGGTYSNGWLTAKVTGFGKYSVMSDSLCPLITATSFREKGRYKIGSVMSFKITDDLSGIESYNGYVDNSWVLFEYDAKTDSLFYKIDSERLDKKQELHDLKIIVTDERSNIAVFNGKFYY
jgi:hypothetical protein